MASTDSVSQGSGGYGEWQPATHAAEPCFTAIHDFEPPTPARLRVEGNCKMPDPGYELRLVKAAPQGINPTILLLNLEERRLPGNFPAQITEVEAKYFEKTDVHYKQVTILPLGLTLDVQEVH